MKWDVNLQNIQDEYTMLTTVLILIKRIASSSVMYISMKSKSNTGSKSFS